VPIRGHERLVWDQPVSSAEELATLGFRAYVDGVPVELTGISCRARPGPRAFECSSLVPALAPGSHAIQVAAHVRGLARAEGLRSAPLIVMPAEPPADPALDLSHEPAIAPDAALRAAVVTTGLTDPTDLAVLPDGRVLVAERQGRIRIASADGLRSEPAAVLDDVTTGSGRGLLSVAIDRSFGATRAVFVLYTAGSGLRLARFTLSGDALYARAILLDGLPAAADAPAATLRSGPDGRLYLALDDGGDPDAVHDLGSYSGKVLRLNPDGTTPADHPGRSPVYAVGVARPVGLGWSADGATLRIVGVDTSPLRRPMSLAASTADTRGADGRLTVARLTLTADAGASSATTYTSDALASLKNNLLVASTTMESVLRVRFASPLVPDASEWIVAGKVGPIRALAVAPDGTLWAATDVALLRLECADC
jgi:glucose/arabinose dehydrogenase